MYHVPCYWTLIETFLTFKLTYIYYIRNEMEYIQYKNVQTFWWMWKWRLDKDKKGEEMDGNLLEACH